MGVPSWVSLLLLGGSGIGLGIHLFRQSAAFPLVAPILAIEGTGAGRALERGAELLRPLDLRHQRNKLLQVAVPATMYALVASLFLLPVAFYSSLTNGGPAAILFAGFAVIVVAALALILPATQTAMTLRYFQLLRLSEGGIRPVPAFGAQLPASVQGAEDLHRIISGRPSGEDVGSR